MHILNSIFGVKIVTDMPRTKRNPPRCQSTPTQVHANSEGTQVHASTEGTSRNATQISPQSEPVAHTDSSTHNEAPPLLQTQSNVERVSGTELGDNEELEDQGPLPTTSKRKCNTMWTVNVRGM